MTKATDESDENRIREVSPRLPTVTHHFALYRGTTIARTSQGDKVSCAIIVATKVCRIVA
eukprot:scaffold61530_cov51-Attheya_sp.AAC.4